MFSFVIVDFQWRIHKGHEQGLARPTLLLLAVRREPYRTTVRPQGRTSLLRLLLRVRLRQCLREMQQNHRYRFQGELHTIIFHKLRFLTHEYNTKLNISLNFHSFSFCCRIYLTKTSIGTKHASYAPPAGNPW